MQALRKVGLGLCFALFAATAFAAQIPLIAGPLDPANEQATLNGLVNTMNATLPSLTAVPRNLLDNGAMTVNQRAATATAATTAGCVEASYSPDRWCADVNMAAGAGQLAVVTSSPTPPPGFINSATLVRNSGALGQPLLRGLRRPSSAAHRGRTAYQSAR